MLFCKSKDPSPNTLQVYSLAPCLDYKVATCCKKLDDSYLINNYVYQLHLHILNIAWTMNKSSHIFLIYKCFGIREEKTSLATMIITIRRLLCCLSNTTVAENETTGETTGENNHAKLRSLGWVGESRSERT